MELKEAFKTAFNDKIWTADGDRSVSGSGSEIRNASTIATWIDALIEIEGVKTVADFPCGDFNWQYLFLNDGLEYKGLDIVPEIVKQNTAKTKKRKNVSFSAGDLTSSKLPSADLLIVRDCLVHLSNEDGLKALKNVCRSDIRLLAITSFINLQVNTNTVAPIWRAQNLQKAPFNLPTPKAILLEQCEEANGIFPDKALIVYEVEAIKAVL